VLTASPAAIARHRKDPGSAWNRWVIHPGDLGLPHHFLDYPDLAVSGRSVLLTMNVFGKKFGSVVARVSLGDLKRARNLKLDYYFDRNGDTYRIAQQGGNRAFVAGHATGTDLLTLAWDRGSPLLFEHRTPHTEIATYDYESLTEGVDWGERLDASVQGGTQRGNELWFAWAEGRSVCLRRCGGGRPVLDDLWPQPHVHVVVVDARTFDLVRERFIHNDDYAIGYPTLATDSLGRVGMSFSFGGGTVGNASPAAGYLTDTEEFHQVVSSPGPGDQGDYMSLRPDWPDQTRFTGSGYVTQDDEPRWIFYRYSR
jgi:hypothetical protein